MGIYCRCNTADLLALSLISRMEIIFPYYTDTHCDHISRKSYLLASYLIQTRCVPNRTVRVSVSWMKREKRSYFRCFTKQFSYESFDNRLTLIPTHSKERFTFQSWHNGAKHTQHKSNARKTYNKCGKSFILRRALQRYDQISAVS